MIKKVINILLFGAVGFVVLLALVTVLLLKGSFFDLNIETEREVILVEKGQNVRTIAEKLDVQNFYKKPFVAFLLMKFMLKGGKIHVGEYEISKGETVIDFINKLKSNVHHYRRITFVEGETVAKYKTQVDSAFGLMGEITIDMPEGYILPGTYNYLYGETKDSIIKRAKEDMMFFVTSEFEKVKSRDENFYLKNIHEVLTLASIVEKESAIGVERTLIAGVFYNRLKKNMKLQSCPTTIYEITKGKYKFDRPLTWNDLKVTGQYNTYYVTGLPLGPIASPGKDSILAVLKPEKTDSLFFVADGIGGHNFSTDFDSHRENIKKYKETIQTNSKPKE